MTTENDPKSTKPNLLKWAAILGGVVVAAWIIGVTENLAGTYLPFVRDDLKIGVPLVAMFVILLTRPQGLFGRRKAARV